MTGRLRAPAEPGDAEVVDAALAGIGALDLPGLLANDAGRDVGLRAGGWSYAIVNDWVDAEAYRAYDLDVEHNRHRAALVEVSADIARVQLDLPG